MLHSGCVKLHQKFRDFVGLPMGLLREESPKNRMNTGLFGSRSGNTVSKQLVALRSSASDNRLLRLYQNGSKSPENQSLIVIRYYLALRGGRERCDRNGHAVFLRPRVDLATTGSEITGISTSSTKLK